MNNSKEIFHYIETIATTSSKTGKEALVKAGVENSPEFLRVCEYAYDPFKVFGVGRKTIEEAATVAEARYLHTGPMRDFTPDTWMLLDQLAKREISGDVVINRLAYEFGHLNAESVQLLSRILLKDLRAGFSESTLNKAQPGLIQDFPYMRCSLPAKSNMPKWKWEEGVFSQEKADGMFSNCDHDHAGVVSFRTRQGTPFPMGVMPELEACVSRLIVRGSQTHGELLVYRKDSLRIEGHTYGYTPVLLPREEGNGILNSLLKGGTLPDDHFVVFQVWDQIAIEAVKTKGKFPVTYAKRFRSLLEQVRRRNAGEIDRIHITPTKIVRSKAEAMAHYRELLKAGKEGTILKSPDAIWEDKTSKDQVKLKLEVPVELKVVGFNEGTGKYQGTLGSLLCQSACGVLEVNVNGRTDTMRDEWWSAREMRRGSIVTVKANGIIESESKPGMKSLFLPVFVEERTDKMVADTLEQIQEQFEAAVEG
jgi:DNA ligase-1